MVSVGGWMDDRHIDGLTGKFIRQTNGWTYGLIYRWTDGWEDSDLRDGLMSGQIDRWTNCWMQREIYG